PQQQFPILPERREDDSWPNPESRDFEGRDVDVYQIVRAWYGYAQKPLPPPTTNTNPAERPDFDPARFRMPRIAAAIFRGYPARAQVYYAEQLQTEGWFDGEGWSIRKFFETGTAFSKNEEFVGQDPTKWRSRPAWAQGYREYLEYARDNGLYLSPRE